ncbi:hypothetical protein SAMN02787142_0598 [Burkholderia sp. WP9]|nr:hypothetical protein SAMN02787142_0598 [Burkholderia sp. WP9]
MMRDHCGSHAQVVSGLGERLIVRSRFIPIYAGWVFGIAAPEAGKVRQASRGARPGQRCRAATPFAASALSSTTSAFLPTALGARGMSAMAEAASAGRAGCGTSSTKRAPLPGAAGASRTEPPCASAISLTSASPMPRPFEGPVGRRCANISNTWGPVFRPKMLHSSVTTNATVLARRSMTSSIPEPSGENLDALPTRLTRHWDSRTAST